ncbi:kinesin-like protein KIN-7J [Silene latifolia]|uniref:kinesin-like protein KIN-7J n=1 Tax=Silene latifolia TaxID=37657 RepID=UPI003D784AEA
MVLEGGDQDLVQGPDTRREKIFVSVRLRPLNGKEIQSNDFADWECINNTTIIFKNCLAERSMYPNAYNFDRVFGNDCSTKKVYEEAAKEVALSVLNGINSSVFAYGQTSSGKTFTMSGITHYAVSDIYDYIEKHKEREFVMKFSAIEIYNENVRDLLSPDPTPLRCLDDPERGTVVERLTEEILRDRGHLLELIAVCEAQRQTGETGLNETSSRSHQILRLTIESSARRFGGGNSSMLAANVNFVDLAGSERTSQTLSTGTRLKEGSHINRSLLTLGKVIRTLSKGRNAHVPYRDSKLTRILHNSLGGNARTAIICTMSPAHSHLEQSRNTLLFASCAKEVSTNAQVNVVMSDKALVKQLKKELAKLETELKTISSVSTKDDVTSILKEKELQIEKMEKEMKELSRQRDLAQSRIEELLRTAGSHQFSRPQDDVSSRQTSESREKISWVDDSSVTSDISDYQRLDVDLATSESFQYLDEHTDFDFSTQTSNVFDNYVHNATPDFAPAVWEEMTAVTTRVDEDMEDNCKEVHCIEVEASIDGKTNLSDPLTGFSQEVIEKEREREKEEEKKSIIEKECIVSVEEMKGRESDKSEVDVLVTDEVDVIPLELKEEMKSMIVKEHTTSSEKDQEFENETNPSDVKCGTQVSENGYTNSSEKEERLSDNSKAEKECTLSSEKKEEIKVENHCDSDYEELVKRIKELQKTIDSLANRNPLEHYSPSMESDRLTNRPSNLSKSRSCKAVLSTIRATSTFDTVVQHHQNQSFGGFDQVAVSERPKKLPKGFDTNDGCDADTSISGFPTTIRDAIRIEMDQDVRNSDVSDSSSIYTSVAGTNGDAKHNPHKLIGSKLDGIMDDLSEPKYSESSDSVRDIASCGMQERDCMSEGTPSSLQSPLSWSEEFENTRFRIIELWHACHIPLVHRTYFYLLFKGDPSDKLYLEVELRRLSFIKNRFDQGQKIVMDGQISTPSSSMKALNQEREMLMKQMYKMIPLQERESLFEKWGIAINSKQRRLQLAQQLWTDSKDMQHIRESASVVAKLVGFADDGEVAKEMFVGPSLNPKTIINRRSYSWISGIPSLA